MYIRRNAQVNLNDKNLDNVRFVKVNSLPAVSQQLTPNQYVDDALDEPTLVRNSKNNDFNNHSLSNMSQITQNSKPIDDNHVVTKSYADSLSGKNGNRPGLSTVINNQDNEFNKNKLTS